MTARRLRSAVRLGILGAALAAGSLFAAAQATADPGMPPCPGPLAFVCSLVPTMPELDHDIDMTKGQPAATVDTERMMPVDVCTVSCV